MTPLSNGSHSQARSLQSGVNSRKFDPSGRLSFSKLSRQMYGYGSVVLWSGLLSLGALSACSDSPELQEGDKNPPFLQGPKDNSDIEVEGLGGDGNDGGDGSTAAILETLPAGFVAADALGGWDVVGPVSDSEEPTSEDCANVLRVIARDFPASHSDFEEGSTGLLPGIVEDELGSDRKPVFADPEEDAKIEDADSFDQWYRNVENVNQAFFMDLWLEPDGDTFVFDSSTFFPLIGFGYSLEDGGEGQEDGFHFTTELHTSFQYKGGEEFTFRGDDDVWVFINNRLAIDLGGVHGAEEGSVALDEISEDFGLVKGGVYNLDLFQAERQTVESNFRIETTLDFTDCGEILEEDIPVQ